MTLGKLKRDVYELNLRTHRLAYRMEIDIPRWLPFILDRWEGDNDRRVNRYVATHHREPGDYGLTNEEAIKIRIKYLKQVRKELEEEQTALKSLYFKGELTGRLFLLNNVSDEMDKINREIIFRRRVIKDPNHANKDFDIPGIKNIPIPQVLELFNITMERKFFKLRPDEKTASASWREENNTWKDFGSGDGGSNIDLVMIINGCDFKQACEELSRLI